MSRHVLIAMKKAKKAALMQESCMAAKIMNRNPEP
jgi:hypothetical protein